MVPGTAQAACLDRALPSPGLARCDDAFQIIILMLEQGGSSLDGCFLALASGLFASLAESQFYISGAIFVVMITQGIAPPAIWMAHEALSLQTTQSVESLPKNSAPFTYLLVGKRRARVNTLPILH